MNKVVVSGGINPDIKKDKSHDNHWGNFVRAANTKIEESQKDLKEGEKVEWHVQRSSLVDRAKNEGKSDDFYTSQVEDMAKSNGSELRWFDDTKGFVNGINTTSTGDSRAGSSLISEFTYHGHGSEAGWWLTYKPMTRDNPFGAGELFDTADLKITKSLAANNPSHYGKRRILPEAFAKNAGCTSWACNSATGEKYKNTFVGSWRKALGLPMKGIVGKSNYSRTHPDYRGIKYQSSGDILMPPQVISVKYPQSPTLGRKEDGGQAYWRAPK